MAAVAGGLAVMTLQHAAGQQASTEPDNTTAGQATATADADVSDGADASLSPALLKEVIVNARRRAENQQTVPVTITAISNTSLEQQDIRNVGALGIEVPSVGFATGASNSTAAYPFIRGIPDVVAYFSEVPVFAEGPTALTGSALYFDLSNVQVLKGPQGTLFGVSADGGALLFEPARPSFKQNGYVQLATGDQGRAQGEAVVNLPFSDTVALRLGGEYQHLDGYVRDLATGHQYGEDNYEVGRVGLLIRPISSLENYLVINYYHSNGIPEIDVPAAVNPAAPVSPAVLAGLEADLQKQQSLGWYSLPSLSYPNPSSLTRQINAANITTWTLSPRLDIKNIIGYSSVMIFTQMSIDGSPYRLVVSGIPPSQQPDPTVATSEELQLQGNAFSGNLNYTVGSFNQWTGDGDSPPSWEDLRDAFGIISVTQARDRGQTHAFYFEGNYDFGGLAQGLKGLKLTAGIRHTKDDRSLQNVSGIAFSPTASEIVTGKFDQSASWSANSFRLGLSYQLSQNVLVYFTDSKGYSSGGFNTSAPPQLRVYSPEALDNFEVGVKSQWRAGGWQGRTNVATWYGNYTNVQAPTTSRVCDSSGNCTLAVVTQNAAQAKIKGLEAELIVLPMPQLELGINGSWMDDSYTSYPSLSPTGQPIDLSGTPFIYTPKWKYAVHATYQIPVSGDKGVVSVGADWAWQSLIINTATTQAEFYDETQPFGVLNASIGWTDVLGHQGVSAWLFGDNLNQDRWDNGQFAAYGPVGLWGPYTMRPRNFGIRVRVDF